jgi:hypothetical protein
MASVLKRDICHPMNNCHHSQILAVTCALSFQIGPIRNSECFLNDISSNASPSELVLCSRTHSNCLTQRLVFETFFGELCTSRHHHKQGRSRGEGVSGAATPGSRVDEYFKREFMFFKLKILLDY